MRHDARGVPVATACAAAVAAFESGSQRLSSFDGDPLEDFAAASAQDPGWLLPHVARAGFLLTLTERALLPQARAALDAKEIQAYYVIEADYLETGAVRLVAVDRPNEGLSMIVLADGGSLDLNRASAVDGDYGANLRRLRLLAGEIFVSTAADPRPFEVHTGHGAIRALGTRFGVRLDGATTRVAVHQHAVEIRPLAGPPRRLAAGEEVDFDAAGVSPSQPLTAGSGAWRDGRLIAIDRRLDDFLGELARHRRGHLAWSPAVAGLRLSGVFRLADSDAVLDNLAASLPIRLHFLTRYWVRVDAA